MSTRRTEAEILATKRSIEVSNMYKVAKKVLLPFKRAITEIQINRVRKEGTFVEAVDVQEKVQQILVNELKQIAGEETLVVTDIKDLPLNANAYVVSPSGSAFNLSMGLETTCLTLAYVQKGDIQGAVTLFPLSEEFYIAEKGQGVDGPYFKLRVAGKEAIDNLVLGFFSPVTASQNEENVLSTYQKLRQLGCHVRMAGNVIVDALRTSGGQYDAYIGMNLNALDVLIAHFYVRESGGFTCGLKGEKTEPGSTEILIANHKLQGKLLKELSQ